MPRPPEDVDGRRAKHLRRSNTGSCWASGGKCRPPTRVLRTCIYTCGWKCEYKRFSLHTQLVILTPTIPLAGIVCACARKRPAPSPRGVSHCLTVCFYRWSAVSVPAQPRHVALARWRSLSSPSSHFPNPCLSRAHIRSMALPEVTCHLSSAVTPPTSRYCNSRRTPGPTGSRGIEPSIVVETTRP